MKLNKMEAILFDSGRVLNESSSGHWFISPKFFDFVDKEVFDHLNSKHVKRAFKKAINYINSIPLIETQESEYEHFHKFYQLFSEELPMLNLSEADILGLTADLVYNPLKYKFFEDGLQLIPYLATNYKLAIVSDAWPSLESVYETAGLRKYFSSFIISSQLGVVKPDPKMYQAALDELGVDPSRALFVDDNLRNCLGAREVGIYPILLVRDKRLLLVEKIKSLGKGYCVISSLNELK